MGEVHFRGGAFHRVATIPMLAMLVLVLSGGAALAESYEYTIDAGEYEIVDIGDGWQQIEMDGFGQLMEPGEPRLPSKIFTIGLPPGGQVRSVQVVPVGVIQLPGTYKIAPAEPPRPADGDRGAVARADERYWARRRAVYASDGLYPSGPGVLVQQGAYRQYDVVDVRFTPFQYRAKSGRLTFYSRAKVIIDYEVGLSASRAGQRGYRQHRPEVDARAGGLIHNFEQASRWYGPADRSGRELRAAEAGESYDYVIITLHDLKQAVEPLASWEMQKGRQVYVATTGEIENDYGGFGTDLPWAIRKFLRAKLSEWGIVKVLIVGDPADIPMRVCHTPRGPFGDWIDYPTDYYYAELSLPDSDSWDADHDGTYGEQGEDAIDFIAEVDVGRIPWSDFDSVRDICKKMAAFEYSTDAAYKKNVLFPMSFFDESTDNAVLAELMLSDFLDPAAWTKTRLYEYGPTHFSTYERDAGLNHTNMVEHWSTGQYAYVCWAAHGSPTRISYNAPNPEWDWFKAEEEPESMTLFSTTDVLSLSDDYPSIVFAHSCSTADPDGPLNLGKMLLGTGSVSYIGAVRPGGYWPGWSKVSDGWDSTLAYWFTRKIYDGGLSVGRALNDANRLMYTDHGWDGNWWSMFTRTLYGNPDLCISRYWPLPALVPTTPSGWDSPIVPRATNDATPESSHVSPTLPGNAADETYLNIAYKNVGGSAAPKHVTYLYVDHETFGFWGYTVVTGLGPGEEIRIVNKGPGTVRGGRHTLSYFIDPGAYDVWEYDRSNNLLGKQFVWSPLALANDTPLTRAAPPEKEAWGVPYGTGWSPNCDGFSFFVDGLGLPVKGVTKWSAVGVLPGGYLSNYDLRVWDIGDYQGSEQGFGGGYIESSSSAIDRSDFVLVNGRAAAGGEYYAGVVNFNGGEDSFRVEEATSAHIQPWPTTLWNGPYTMPVDGVLDVYEVNLTAGRWTFKLEQTNPSGGICDLAMALYGPGGAHYAKHEYVGGAYADSNGHGQPESFSTTVLEDGWYALVVWKADSDDYSHQTEYRIGYGQGGIEVRWPNGGDVLPVGAVAPIVWRNYGDTGSEVTVSISRDGGTGWSKIDPAAPNTGYYDWTVTGPASTHCLIRIESNSFTDVADASDDVFTIIAPSITVTAPNGGESWYVGGSEKITWTTANLTGSCKVRISRDRGTTWSVLGTSNTGLLEWTVTGPVSSECLIDVTAVSYPSVKDASDGTFTIGERSISVLSPNGGETWYTGETATVTWLSQGIVGDYEVSLSRDGGQTWETLGTATKQEFSWAVMGPDSSECRVRVRSQVNPGVGDASDANFAIATRSITVTAPNGGETWYAGGSYAITWSSAHVSGEVAIAISRDGGTTWAEIALTTENDGSYLWQAGGAPSSQCRIRVASTADASVSDVSDASFALSEPTIVVTSPNGGETWFTYEGSTITWASYGATGSYVGIEVSRDGGATWSAITSITENDGSYAWTVGGADSAECLVRVASRSVASAVDVSDGVFAIATRSLSLVSPNGGEVWYDPDPEVVAWSSEHVEGDVSVEISRDGGATWSALGSVAASSGAYPWTVAGPASEHCLVRLVSAAHPYLSDTSDAEFGIEIRSIALTSPNGGETWFVGEPEAITWTSENVDGDVAIFVSSNSGATWTALEMATANDGSYEWSVLTPPASEYRVLVLSVANPAVMDLSDGDFTVAERSITLLYPNGGESLTVGRPVTITWTSQHISGDVEIAVAIDGGAKWLTVIVAAPGTGSYEWRAFPKEEACLIRITSLEYPSVSDTSDGFFSVGPPIKR